MYTIAICYCSFYFKGKVFVPYRISCCCCLLLLLLLLLVFFFLSLSSFVPCYFLLKQQWKKHAKSRKKATNKTFKKEQHCSTARKMLFGATFNTQQIYNKSNRKKIKAAAAALHWISSKWMTPSTHLQHHFKVKLMQLLPIFLLIQSICLSLNALILLSEGATTLWNTLMLWLLR